MDFDSISEISNHALKVGLMISAPMLLGSLFIGIVISIFQAVTQINEQTLTFIPKILVILAAISLGAPWMGEQLKGFTTDLITNIPRYVVHK